MGALQVVFSPPAVADLEQIIRHIAQDDREAAERFGNRLVQRAWSLAQPLVHNAGGALRKRPGVRKLIEGNYLILYRVFEDQNKVRVLRFWHGARDPESLRLDQ